MDNAIGTGYCVLAIKPQLDSVAYGDCTTMKQNKAYNGH